MRKGSQNTGLCIVVLLVMLGCTNRAGAQSLKDTLKIGEISVFSRRPVEQTAVTVTRLDSAVLSRHTSQSLAELMAENSTLFIKSLGRGALSTVSFRGTAPSHTRVTWNGLELNSPMLGMVDFSEIPVFFIDEVSVIHGNSSLTEMPGALGGILDLGTHPGQEKGLSGSFLQGLGSYGTREEYGMLEAGGSRIHAVTRLFWNHSDNDFRYRNYDTPDSVNLLTGQKYFPGQGEQECRLHEQRPSAGIFVPQKRCGSPGHEFLAAGVGAEPAHAEHR